MYRFLPAFVLTLSLLASACGGGTQEALPEPTATPRPIPTAEATTNPDSTIPFADINVRVAAIDRLVVRPGEALTIEAIVYNARPERASIRLRTVAADGVAPQLSVSSVGIDGYGFFELAVDVTVPDDAEPGDEFSFGTQAIRSTDADHRLTATTTLVVADIDGDRPEVLPNRAETATNERVLAYVIGNDTGDNLDFASLRVVGGAFRAAETEVTTTGFVGYTPYENLTGPDAILYELCTSEGLCDTAVFSVEVVPV